VRRNDYDRGLFNGDSGLVLWTTDGEGDSPRLAAVFRKERTFLAYPLDMVGHLLELAWAITVHKSQGSEYAHVAIVLPTSETPLLSRELLYTAVTRSSRSVLLIGPRSMIESCVLRSVERSSGIAEQLG
jgi:exodeoxyribonuclease V alpha subunit